MVKQKGGFLWRKICAKIDASKPKNWCFTADTLLSSFDQTIPQLPPQVCVWSDTNWTWLGEARREENNGDLSLQVVMYLTTDENAAITEQNWASYSKHLQILVERYWGKDGQLLDEI
jgi:hypothetical protein